MTWDIMKHTSGSGKTSLIHHLRASNNPKQQRRDKYQSLGKISLDAVRAFSPFLDIQVRPPPIILTSMGGLTKEGQGWEAKKPKGDVTVHFRVWDFTDYVRSHGI